MPSLIDITPPISAATAVWPGDTPFSRAMLCEIAGGANIDLSAITTTPHLGAHADGECHYAPSTPPPGARAARGVGEMPLSHYLGPCQVIDAPVPTANPGEERRVRVQDLVGGLDQVRTPRVLIRTGSFRGFHDWNSDFAGLDPALIDALADRGVVTIGVDTPSVDPQTSKHLPAHKAIFRRSIAILEGLNLAQAPSGSGHEYELIALPLKLMGCDASPVRAVLRPVSTRDPRSLSLDTEAAMRLVRFPLYVLIADEQSFMRCDNARDLQYFEEIDLEEAAHYAWDASGHLYHLWYDGMVVPRLIDASGLRKWISCIDQYERLVAGQRGAVRSRCSIAELRTAYATAKAKAKQ